MWVKILSITGVVCVMLTACGGSSSPDTQVANANSNSEVIEDGLPPSVSLINASNAKNLAIDVLELLDTTFLPQTLVAREFTQPQAGDSNCDTGGSRQQSEGAALTIRYTDCRLETNDADVILNGNASLILNRGELATTPHNYSLTLEDFSIKIGAALGRTVTLNGVVQVDVDSVRSLVSADEVTVNDSQSNLQLTNLSAKRTLVNGSVNNNFTFTMTSTRFGFDVSISTAEQIIGTPVSCPDAGKLNIKATDDSSVVITGTAGATTLGLSINGQSDNIDCSSIGLLPDLTASAQTPDDLAGGDGSSEDGDSSSGGGLTPPPPP